MAPSTAKTADGIADGGRPSRRLVWDVLRGVSCSAMAVSCRKVAVEVYVCGDNTNTSAHRGCLWVVLRAVLAARCAQRRAPAQLQWPVQLQPGASGQPQETAWLTAWCVMHCDDDDGREDDGADDANSSGVHRWPPQPTHSIRWTTCCDSCCPRLLQSLRTLVNSMLHPKNCASKGTAGLMSDIEPSQAAAVVLYCSSQTFACCCRTGSVPYSALSACTRSTGGDTLILEVWAGTYIIIIMASWVH